MATSKISEAIQHQEPSEKEVPTPPGREVLVARDGDPAWKGARRDLPGFPGGAEHACRVEGLAEHHHLTDKSVLGLARPNRQRWAVEIGAIANIERRMRIEDLQPAHQEERETHGVDPMRDAHEPGMTVVPALRRRGFTC